MTVRTSGFAAAEQGRTSKHVEKVTDPVPSQGTSRVVGSGSAASYTVKVAVLPSCLPIEVKIAEGDAPVDPPSVATWLTARV